MIEPTREKAKIPSLEGLRGLMAWWVVLGHISLTFGWHLPLIDHNTLPVDVFILLSGFVIARLIDRKGEAYGGYIVRRAFRLFPLYLVVLFVSALLLRVQLDAWLALPIASPSNGRRIAIAQNALQYFGPHLLVHIPLFQGLVPPSWLPSAAYSIVGQAWSISLEWQFYLLAPFFLYATARRSRWLGAAVLVIVLIALSKFFAGAFLGNKILHFGVGICSYLAFDRPHERVRWVLLALGCGFVAIVMQGAVQFVPFAIWTATLCSAAMPLHHKGHALAAALGTRLAVHWGDISYSVYMVHMIPLYGSIYLLTAAGLSIRALEIAVFFATVIGAYGLARITHATIENPGIRLGARLTSSYRKRATISRANRAL